MKQIELDQEICNDLLYEIKHMMVFKTNVEHQQYIKGAKAMLVQLQLPLDEAVNCDTYKQTA